MDNIKNDHYYITKIQEDLLFIVEHMKDVDRRGHGVETESSPFLMEIVSCPV